MLSLLQQWCAAITQNAVMQNHIPSKCLYFSPPLRDKVEIISETRNTITLGDRILCFRIPSRYEMRFFSRCDKDVITVVDDNYWAIVKDGYLPASYRARMLSRLMYNEARLRQMTDKWVVTSPRLANNYPGAECIDPCWNISSASDHDRKREGLHLGFLGTRSHLHDLHKIIPFVMNFLRDSTESKLSIFLGKHCPRELAQLPNVKNYEPMRWQQYRQLLKSLEIDISLLPSQNTEVNACRSRNKLFEAVFAGAICLHDERYAHSDYAKMHQLGLSCEPSDLPKTLKGYCHNRSYLAKLQYAAKKNAVALQSAIIAKQKIVLLSPVN